MAFRWSYWSGNPLYQLFSAFRRENNLLLDCYDLMIPRSQFSPEKTSVLKVNMQHCLAAHEAHIFSTSAIKSIKPLQKISMEAQVSQLNLMLTHGINLIELLRHLKTCSSAELCNRWLPYRAYISSIMISFLWPVFLKIQPVFGIFLLFPRSSTLGCLVTCTIQ